MDLNSSLNLDEMVIKYSIKINFAISTYYDNGILDWKGSAMRQIWTYDASWFALE